MLFTKYLLGLLALMGVAVVVASRPHPTAIVSTVQAAGAGDVATATTDDLRAWFDGGHAGVAQRIAPACTEAVKHVVQATWKSSDEGRVCQAALYSVNLTELRSFQFRATN